MNARIINTSSVAGLQESIGKGNYGGGENGYRGADHAAEGIGPVVAGLLAKAEIAVPVYGA
ncbi:hypothetical protein GFS60_01920 [Rhodococcus sp. WAY2]|nr:hypothetical protein GFS60_01920 [Rhodococcus sp. WAY2]